METRQEQGALRSGWRAAGLRAKLIVIFVLIKVLPLVLLAWFAWWAARDLGDTLAQRSARMADSMLLTIRQSGDSMTRDAIRALDERSRESIERLTTDTARAVAAFLHDRDNDIRQAAQLPPDEAVYRNFLRHRQRELFGHGAWRLSSDQTHWEPATPASADASLAAQAAQALPDNARDFHARPPEYLGEREMRPLFREMSFIGLDGVERLRVLGDTLRSAPLRDVRQRANTWAQAESYWPELRKLKPGEIYVSDVIGSYVGSNVVGPYTPAAAAKAGIDFAPEQSAYAGTENPLGRRFAGIVRWVMPVQQNGRITGYVSLALDHDHIRQFTDRILPTEQRYTPIIDAIAGNYAFMWDHLGRAIAHPRDYMIPGFDARNGEPVVPWLDETLYAEWQASGKPWAQFAPTVEPFRDQSLKRKPALAMVKAGTLGLDCRYLNFSPQCAGWKQLTEQGGSGSFVIFFSGLWKLTTAAAIPYHTGQYGRTPLGFGFVTIGANVDDFHRAATASAQTFASTLAAKDAEFKAERSGMLESIGDSLRETALTLGASTLLMIVAVIGVAVWMAQFMTKRITTLIEGIRRIESGDLAHRLEVSSQDEMGQLAGSLNRMADSVQESFTRSEEGRRRAEEANQLKSDFLAGVSHELRTPLNGILGFAELIELEAGDEAQREYAVTIRKSGQHLLGVVNDLLDLAKIEAGRLELHPVQVVLPELLQDLAGLHGAVARAKGLEMCLEIAPEVPQVAWLDALRLRQILNNLLHNAVKFTDHGWVAMSASMAEGRLSITVGDSGCGIAPEAQQLVFERFRQADSGNARRHGGTGLGLSIARELAQLMGGTISLHSTLGEGASFTLVLPCEEVVVRPLPVDA